MESAIKKQSGQYSSKQAQHSKRRMAKQFQTISMIGELNPSMQSNSKKNTGTLHG